MEMIVTRKLIFLSNVINQPLGGKWSQREILGRPLILNVIVWTKSLYFCKLYHSYCSSSVAILPSYHLSHFTKAGSSFNIFSRLYISQCSSFSLLENSTNKNALLQIGCLSVTWHRKSLCSSQYFSTFYSLWTGSFLLHSLLSIWKFLYKTGENKSSVSPELVRKYGMASPLNFVS